MTSTYHNLIPLDEPDRWRDALVGIKHTFCHTWEHCYAMYLTTENKTFLYTFEKDGVRIVCPIIEREFEGYTDITKPFGFSGFVGMETHPEFSKYWREFTLDRGYVTGYPGLSPVFDYSGLFDSSEVSHYNNCFILDLQPSIYRILRNMSASRREQFNNWEELKKYFVYDRSELENFFHENYSDFLKRVGAAPYYFLSSETISYIFALENSVAVGAKENGKIVSAYLFLYTKYMATGLYVLSLPEGRHHSAPIIWDAAKELRRRRIPFLNMGGASGSLAEFKRRFGAKKTPLLSLKQIYKRDIYEKLCKTVDANPNDSNGYFPPYRKAENRR